MGPGSTRVCLPFTVVILSTRFLPRSSNSLSLPHNASKGADNAPMDALPHNVWNV